MQIPDQVVDKQDDYYREFDRRIRRHLRTLVSDAVIEEHRNKPLGQHSDALDRLLNYFRRGGMAGKLGILREGEADAPRYRIVRFSGARGVPSEIEADSTYASLDAAYHAVFLRRCAALMDESEPAKS